MSQALLVRDIPPELRAWIADSSHALRISQNQFMLALLQRSQEAEQPLPLFDALRPAAASGSVGLPFRFIDLFAGIGGMRLGLQAVGGECVFSCEWDPNAQRTYKAWHGELPVGDINEPGLIESITAHDILAAGFPCQPFSIAGVSKKKSLGRAHGFDDVKQGNLFFRIMDVVDLHRPPVLLLENVKNLGSHDGGETWRRIKSEIESREYAVFHTIIDAAHWVPQHRERIFIVCLNKQVFGPKPAFSFSPLPDTQAPQLKDILDDAVDPRYTLSPALWKYLQDYADSHRAKGNGFGFGLADREGVTRTLSARYYKDGSEILIPQKGKNPRKLTPRESGRLMGFPDHLQIVVSDTQAYRQFGNSIVPAVVEWVGRDIVRAMCDALRRKAGGSLLSAPNGRKKRQIAG